MPSPILTLLDAPRLQRYYAEGHWRAETIHAAVRTRANASPDRVAVRERTTVATYRELVVAADQLAATLHVRGVRPGQRVAVWLPSRIEVAVAVLACSRGGWVVCPSLHPDHTVGEVATLMRRMGAAALVTERGYGADADQADLAEALGDHELACSIRLAPRSTNDDGAHALADLIGQLEPSARVPEARTDPDSVVYLAFTSGTTGEPKGVMQTDNTLLAPTRALARDWNLGEDEVIYSLSPLSHNLGFGAMILALSAGGELVVHDLPRDESLAQRLADTRASFAFGVPTHAIDLLGELDRGVIDGLPALRGFRISGAAIPPHVARSLLGHGIVPQSGYGMTEAGSHHYTLADDDPELIVGSSGRPFAGHHAHIVAQDDVDREVPPGEVGQITSEGPSVMVGYFDDQTRTEQAFNRAGWLLTGDLGWVDDQGYIRITGRKKDLIIRGGRNIHPARIEELATTHPAIAHAAAIPVPHDRLGEKVGLVVAYSEGRSLTADELLLHLHEQGLSRYDMPEHLATVSELPLTASGKIAKRDLLDQLAAGNLEFDDVRFVPPLTN